MSNLKVLFITRKWSPAIGGMETYSKELTKELDSKVDLKIMALPGQTNGKPPSPISLIFFFISTSFFLFSKRNKFDIIHFGDLVLFPLAWLDSIFSASHTRIITVHGLDIIYGNREGIVPNIYNLFIKLISKNSYIVDAYISNSKNTADLAEQKNLIPVHPVPLGVVIQNYKIPDQPPSATPKRYLFFFGRVVKRKGLAWFLNNVLPHLPKDIVLLAAGKIWEQDEIKNHLENRFQHLGIVSDELLTYYCRNSVAVIVPNIRNPKLTDVEGFGLVTLDAAARGGIVLASKTEGITDAIKDAETGFLLPPENPGKWVNKINEILKWSEEQRNVFKKNTETCLRENYSWNRVAKNTVSIYQKFS